MHTLYFHYTIPHYAKIQAHEGASTNAIGKQVPSKKSLLDYNTSKINRKYRMEYSFFLWNCKNYKHLTNFNNLLLVGNIKSDFL